MRIVSRQLGEFDIREDSLLRIHGGLIGLEEMESFCLFATEDSHPFRWLLSTENPDLLMAVVDPDPFLCEPYEVVLAEADRGLLDLHPNDPVEVWTIVSPSSGTGRITINLKGPIVVNPGNRTGKQLVSYSSKQPLRQPVWVPGGSGPVTGRTVVRITDRRAA